MSRSHSQDGAKARAVLIRAAELSACFVASLVVSLVLLGVLIGVTVLVYTLSK